MEKILFVCLGNICRSPMAEAILRDKIAKNSLSHSYIVDSCGTGGWHEGEPPHHGTRAILKDFGISDKGIFARKINDNDIISSHYIFCMDNQNKEDVLKLAKKSSLTESIHLYLDYTQISVNKSFEVPDPYYTGRFSEVFAMLDDASEVFVKKLLSKSL